MCTTAVIFATGAIAIQPFQLIWSWKGAQLEFIIYLIKHELCTRPSCKGSFNHITASKNKLFILVCFIFIYFILSYLNLFLIFHFIISFLILLKIFHSILFHSILFHNISFCFVFLINFIFILFYHLFYDKMIFCLRPRTRSWLYFCK